jgi:hypothetical protein
VAVSVVEAGHRIPIWKDNDQHKAIAEHLVEPGQSRSDDVWSRLIDPVVEARRSIDVCCAARNGLVTGWSRDRVPTHTQKFVGSDRIVAFYTADETARVGGNIQRYKVAWCFGCHYTTAPGDRLVVAYAASTVFRSK